VTKHKNSRRIDYDYKNSSELINLIGIISTVHVKPNEKRISQCDCLAKESDVKKISQCPPAASDGNRKGGRKTLDQQG
jgi:hypothetical protein